MENLITIKADLREDISKKACKSLRANGKIPAIVYGITAESIPISVALSDIKGIMKSEKKENSILRIVQSDKAKFDAMIKEIQYDYLSDHIIHIDFIRIDLNKLVEVEVPVILFGEAIGVKTEDGLLEFIHRVIHIRCLPTQIPKEIRVDVSALHLNQSIKVENLPKTEEYQFISPANTVICAVAAKAKEEVVEVPEVAEVVEGAVEGAAPAAAPAAGAAGVAAAPAAAEKEKGKEKDKGKEKGADKGKGKEKKEG
ncbi:MAG: 50S ribosomal protein L25 [Candidatus Aminicenantes bacterium]|nr:50S ribosomal protein L25 [Candidatus Aminicenantes bacterium]